MRILVYLLFFMTLTSFSVSARVIQNHAPNADFFVNKSDTNLEQSIMIRRVSDRKILFEHNAHKALTPASLAKLFAAAGFLKSFGKKNNLKTSLYHSGTRIKGVVKGDLIIKGGGDPRLVNEDLWNIALDMKHLGYREFTGDIVLDNSLFSSDDINKDRIKKYSRNAYDAPISALGVNFNTYNVVVGPGKKVGSKAHVSLYPYDIAGTKIINHVKTVNTKRKNYVGLNRKVVGGQEVIEVHGRIYKDSRLRKFYRAAYDPIRFTGETIRSFLKAQNIIVKGKVREGKLASYKQAQKVLHYKSQPIAKLTKDFLRYSNNFMTDMLVSALGAYNSKKEKKLDSDNFYQAGLQSITGLLPQKSLNQSPFVFTSGSGLEPENKMSSYQVVELLIMMSNNFDVFPEFLNALPKSGVNGSLKKRFKEARLKSVLGKIRAKTGTLTSPVSVSSLAGYMYHPKHKMIAFSIIQNGRPGKKQPNILVMRQAQEYGLARVLKTI